MPIVVNACIVSREGYYKRYHARYGRHTWNMRRSAIVILLERSTKYVKACNGTSLTLYFEMCGESEDQVLRNAYGDLRTKGHPFDQTNADKYSPLVAGDLSALLAERPSGRRKDTELLQIADLCLFPVATSRNGQPNRAFERFRETNILMDSRVSGHEAELGIKYYCFD